MATATSPRKYQLGSIGNFTKLRPGPHPSAMLHWKEDVVPMIDATMNTRDSALIATAWDSGARSGEIRDLTVGDVTDHRHGLQITLSGKPGSGR